MEKQREETKSTNLDLTQIQCDDVNFFIEVSILVCCVYFVQQKLKVENYSLSHIKKYWANITSAISQEHRPVPAGLSRRCFQWSVQWTQIHLSRFAFQRKS